MKRFALLLAAAILGATPALSQQSPIAGAASDQAKLNAQIQQATQDEVRSATGDAILQIAMLRAEVKVLQGQLAEAKKAAEQRAPSPAGSH